LRQTVADLMQLVRVIQVGVDVDGDGVADLDAERIYYAGQSFGGIYGVKFLALEDSIRAGVANVPGGAIIEIARLSPIFRPLVTLSLTTRVPALLNAPPPIFFIENIPLRDLPPVINTVPGAMEIRRSSTTPSGSRRRATPSPTRHTCARARCSSSSPRVTRRCRIPLPAPSSARGISATARPTSATIWRKV
jgi:hypothetical protein